MDKIIFSGGRDQLHGRVFEIVNGDPFGSELKAIDDSSRMRYPECTQTGSHLTDNGPRSFLTIGTPNDGNASAVIHLIFHRVPTLIRSECVGSWLNCRSDAGSASVDVGLTITPDGAEGIQSRFSWVKASS